MIHVCLPVCERRYEDVIHEGRLDEDTQPEDDDLPGVRPGSASPCPCFLFALPWPEQEGLCMAWGSARRPTFRILRHACAAQPACKILFKRAVTQ